VKLDDRIESWKLISTSDLWNNHLKTVKISPVVVMKQKPTADERRGKLIV
jgi:hypothetical protein